MYSSIVMENFLIYPMSLSQITIEIVVILWFVY
jgi:hypothetical protein